MEFRIEEGDYAWSAWARFDSWIGYRVESDGSAAGEGDGRVQIVFAPEGRDEAPLLPEERALAAWLLDHEPAVSERVKDAIHAEYLRLRDSDAYGYAPEDRARTMPAVAAREDMKRLVALHSVNVHQVARDGVPYLGFELRCSWDPEHGLGVLTHGERIVSVGGADTAILLWMAEKDARSR
jgi:hypothetical protein